MYKDRFTKFLINNFIYLVHLYSKMYIVANIQISMSVFSALIKVEHKTLK